MATKDEEIQLKGLKEIIKKMHTLLKLPTPTHVGRVIHNFPKEITGNPDPYKEMKTLHIKEGLKVYPKLKEIVSNLRDTKLEISIKIASIGNLIDFARGGEFDLEKNLENVEKQNFPYFDYNDFIKDLKKVDEILYIGDNAGETIFDKVFMETLVEEYQIKKILYAVRGKPVINDATFDDAIQSEINTIAEIIDSGTDAPGVILEYCNKEFKEVFYNAKLIISKGQGNFEALSEEKKDGIYFLFKVKCPAVAKHLKVKIGNAVFKKKRKKW
jgi:hypothetical protein